MPRWIKGSLCRLAVTLTLVGLAGPSGASEFYENGGDGWHFYERDPDPPKEKEKEKPKPPPPPKPKKAKKPAKKKPDEKPKEKGPTPFSAAWLQKNLEKYRERAIDKPTEANVAAYMYLQRVAMDKASRFAETTRQVRRKYPLLNEQTRRPLARAGQDAMDEARYQKRREQLKRIGPKVGIWFFFSQECSTCTKQGEILKGVAQDFNIDLFPVSLDGHPLRTEEGEMLFQDYKVDEGQAKKLGIARGPALYMFTEKKGLTPLAHHTIAANSLEKKLQIAALDTGLISREEYNATRQVKGGRNLIGPQGQMPHLNREQAQNPQAVIRTLQNRLKRNQ